MILILSKKKKIGLKCLSMRMALDLLHDLTNMRIVGLFHTCMWQSRHSEVDVHILTKIDECLIESTSDVRNMICVHVFVCVFVFI